MGIGIVSKKTGKKRTMGLGAPQGQIVTVMGERWVDKVIADWLRMRFTRHIRIMASQLISRGHPRSFQLHALITVQEQLYVTGDELVDVRHIPDFGVADILWVFVNIRN